MIFSYLYGFLIIAEPFSAQCTHIPIGKGPLQALIDKGEKPFPDSSWMGGTAGMLTSLAMQLHFRYWFFVTTLPNAKCHMPQGCALECARQDFAPAQLFVQPIIKSNKGLEIQSDSVSPLQFRSFINWRIIPGTHLHSHSSLEVLSPSGVVAPRAISRHKQVDNPILGRFIYLFG